MKQKHLRRIVAGSSAITLAAGLTAAFGMSTATADPPYVTWADGGSNYKRTVSDNNPAIGDTITMTTNFYRSKTPVEYVEAVKDIRDACLTFVSAGPSNSLSQGTEPNGQAYSRVQGSWSVYPNIEPKTRAFEFTYRVSETCPIGVPLTSGMHYGGTLGPGEYNDKGPNITVKQAASATALAVAPDPEADATSTLTATVEPAAATGEVEFFNGDTSLGKASLADQKASIDWKPALNQGGQNFSITAKYLGDTNRKASTSEATTGTIIVGLQAPGAPNSLASSANPATVGEAVTISGRAEANSDVKVTAGAQSCDAKTNGNGAFSCSITPDTAGDIAITATATNAAGTGTASAPLNLTVKPAPTAPAAPTSLAVNPSSLTAGSTASVSGKAEAGSTVNVTAAGTDCETTADAAGNFSCDITPTESGDITVTATNGVGTSAPATLQVTVNAAPVAPSAPEVSLSSSSVKVGDTVTATINTVANATVAITVDGSTFQVIANGDGVATYSFQPTQAGTTTVSATATNDGGTSPATTKTVEVAAAPQGQAIVSVNPTAPVAGDTAKISVTGVDANSTVTVKSGDQPVCTATADATGTAKCDWKPTAGSHELTITTTVDGAEQVVTTRVTVSEAPVVDPGPGGENPGDGNGGGAGSLGSLSGIFGSMN